MAGGIVDGRFTQTTWLKEFNMMTTSRDFMSRTQGPEWSLIPF
jgi:hypothetical protein